ncbi:MAG: hypothetical protein HQ538_05815 [Parcubacteria group bacterium]|nr:hypothetical protein [Parcubacteria group bacterium]
MPKKAQAVGPVFDIKAILNNLLVSIWKSVLFPLIKEIIIGYITTGEFPMSMDEFKTWLVEDLLFQTMESVFNEFANFSLCSEFSMNIRIALGQNELAPDRQPNCTYDQSQWMQIIEHAVDAEREDGLGGEVLGEELRQEFFRSFHLSAQGANNQYGAWWEVQDRVTAEATRQEDQYNVELSANRGFLGQRDCSRGEDENNDGEVSGVECTTVTTGETVAGSLESYNNYTEGAIHTEVFSDLIALFGNVIDLVINQAIEGGISALSKAGKNKNKNSVTEYMEASETSQSIGGNRSFSH